MPFGGSKNPLDGVRAAFDFAKGKALGKPMGDPGFVIDASNVSKLGETAYGHWQK